MAWTKAKTAIVAGIATFLMAGTATFVVKNIPHPARISADPVPVEFPLAQRDAGPNIRPGPGGEGPGGPIPRPSPNARFANLTPGQRVQQARRHSPESADELRK